MCHSRGLNNKLNHIHERALRIVYYHFHQSFSPLLINNNYFTIHHKNLQLLATELFKEKANISREIMNKIFDFSKNSTYELKCGSCLSRSNIHSTHFGIESIASIAGKIWNKIPNEIKEASALTVFKSKIKNGLHRVALVDFAKHIWDKWVLSTCY